MDRNNNTAGENDVAKKMTLICKIPLNKLERVPEKKKYENLSSNNVLPNSDEIDKENMAVRKVLRDIHGVNGKRSSGSMRDAVINKNFVKKVKASDVCSTSNSFLATMKDTESKNRDVNESNEEKSLHGAAIAKKLKYGEFSRKRSKHTTSKIVPEDRKEENEKKGTSSESAAIEKKSKGKSLLRNKFKLKKVQLDVELERLRNTVRKCHAALEPVQNYTYSRLEYYRSISNENSLTPVSRKRKYFEDEEAQDSSAHVYNGEWTCEVEGARMKFRRLNEEK